jgi:hypothetical protein
MLNTVRPQETEYILPIILFQMSETWHYYESTLQSSKISSVMTHDKKKITLLFSNKGVCSLDLQMYV